MIFSDSAITDAKKNVIDKRRMNLENFNMTIGRSKSDGWSSDSDSWSSDSDSWSSDSDSWSSDTSSSSSEYPPPDTGNINFTYITRTVKPI